MPERQHREGRLPRHVLPMAVGALAGLILAVVAAVGLGLKLWGLPAGGPSAQLGGKPPALEPTLEPALETAPQADRAQYTEAQARRQSSTGWVDRAHGVAHIPLDDALQLVAEGRLPLPGKPGTSGNDAPHAEGGP